jgi:hypothetical protein
MRTVRYKMKCVNLDDCEIVNMVDMLVMLGKLPRSELHALFDISGRNMTCYTTNFETNQGLVNIEDDLEQLNKRIITELAAKSRCTLSLWFVGCVVTGCFDTQVPCYFDSVQYQTGLVIHFQTGNVLFFNLVRIYRQ